MFAVEVELFETFQLGRAGEVVVDPRRLLDEPGRSPDEQVRSGPTVAEDLVSHFPDYGQHPVPGGLALGHHPEESALDKIADRLCDVVGAAVDPNRELETPTGWVDGQCGEQGPCRRREEFEAPVHHRPQAAVSPGTVTDQGERPIQLGRAQPGVRVQTTMPRPARWRGVHHRVARRWTQRSPLRCAIWPSRLSHPPADGAG